MATWTKPYFGVQHLDGLKRGFQVSITAYSDTVVTAYLLVPGGGFSSADEDSFGSPEMARAWGERRAADLDAYT